jgi:hypothetical protein
VSDLVAFLRARLDEDEAAARAVEDNSAPWDGQWEADGNHALRTYNGWVLATAGTPGGEFPPGVLAHIARHDPARVLREVEAKRAIVDAYAGTDGGSPRDRDRGRWDALNAAVSALATVYRDHPDYDEAWKP